MNTAHLRLNPSHRILPLAAILACLLLAACAKTTYRYEEVNYDGFTEFAATKDGRPLTGMLLTSQYGGSGANQHTPYKDGKPHGQRRTYYPDGTLWEESSYVNGLQEGVEKWYRENGTLWITATYKNGKKDGPEKEYHRNGVVSSEIQYVNGEKHGLGKSYYESGALWSEVLYRNGKAIGPGKGYYESGALQWETPYKNDKKEGLKKEYYEDGVILRTTSYKDDVKNGPEKEYYPSGKLKRQVTNAPYKSPDITNDHIYGYEQGLERLYDEKGRLTRETWYDHGSVVKERILIPGKATDPKPGETKPKETPPVS